MTTRKTLGLMAVTLSMVAAITYKTLRRPSPADSASQRTPSQPASSAQSEVLPSSYESLLDQYKALARQLEALAGEVHDQQVDFLKGALRELLGVVKAPSPRANNLVDTEIPNRFATLLEILKYQGLTKLTLSVIGGLDSSNTKLLYLEQRLRELDQSALAIKASNVLRRAGLFSGANGSLVFVLESVKNVGPKKSDVQIVEPGSCIDPALPGGLSGEFKAALCAQSQLLAAAQQTNDVILRQWLVTAAGAVAHKGVSQSVDPYYYALLAQRYHRYQKDLENIESQKDVALKNHDIQTFFKLFAEEQEIVAKSNQVVDSALYKGPNASADYISVFGKDETAKPDVISAPSKEARLSRITIVNRTNQTIAAYVGDAFFSITKDGSVTREVAGAGYPLLAWAANQVGAQVLGGRSFLAVDEGKEYTIGVRVAGGAEISGSTSSSPSPPPATSPKPSLPTAGNSKGNGSAPDSRTQSVTDLSGLWTFAQASGVGNLTQAQRARDVASGDIAVTQGKDVYNQQGMVLRGQRLEFVKQKDGRFCEGQDSEWQGNEATRPCYASAGPNIYKHIGPFESPSALGCTIEMRGTSQFVEECTYRGGSPNFKFATRAKQP